MVDTRTLPLPHTTSPPALPTPHPTPPPHAPRLQASYLESTTPNSSLHEPGSGTGPPTAGALNASPHVHSFEVGAPHRGLEPPALAGPRLCRSERAPGLLPSCTQPAPQHVTPSPLPPHTRIDLIHTRLHQVSLVLEYCDWGCLRDALDSGAFYTGEAAGWGRAVPWCATLQGPSPGKKCSAIPPTPTRN